MHQSSIFGFFISRYKYTLLERNYQVVLRTGDFVDFIGFDKAIVTKASNGTKLPNITRSVDNIFIQSNVISDSVVSGDNSDILYRFSVDNLPLRYPFHIEPKRSLFSNICEVSFKVTLESDDNVIFRSGADDGRFIVTRFFYGFQK